MWSAEKRPTSDILNGSTPSPWKSMLAKKTPVLMSMLLTSLYAIPCELLKIHPFLMTSILSSVATTIALPLAVSNLHAAMSSTLSPSWRYEVSFLISRYAPRKDTVLPRKACLMSSLMIKIIGFEISVFIWLGRGGI